MSLKKTKITIYLAIIAITILASLIYYLNFIKPQNREIQQVSVKNFLIDTKSEDWLQNRIDIGISEYETHVEGKRQAWLADYTLIKDGNEKCQKSSDAYRMKHSYECEKFQSDLIQLEDENKVKLSVIGKFPIDRFFNKSEQEKFIDRAILKECSSVKTIRQARKIGCYY